MSHHVSTASPSLIALRLVSLRRKKVLKESSTWPHSSRQKVRIASDKIHLSPLISSSLSLFSHSLNPSFLRYFPSISIQFYCAHYLSLKSCQSAHFLSIPYHIFPSYHNLFSSVPPRYIPLHSISSDPTTQYQGMAGRCKECVAPSLNSSFVRLDEKAIAEYVCRVSRNVAPYLPYGL